MSLIQKFDMQSDDYKNVKTIVCTSNPLSMRNEKLDFANEIGDLVLLITLKILRACSE